MHFRGLSSLEEILYSHLLPGIVALSGLLLFVSLFRKDLMTDLIRTDVNDFLLALLVFLAAIILGNVVDAVRHYLFDRIQRKYGQYRGLWPPSPSAQRSARLSAISEDPLCELVRRRGSVTEKMELRQWLRFNQYYLGELLGNLALTTPFVLGVLAFYLRLAIYEAILIFLVGLLLSWFMFKVSSIYISNFEHNVSRLK